TSFAKGQLKSLVERIEKLEEEKKAVAGDIKEIYAEAKAHGFDTKILRKVIGLRKKDLQERARLDVGFPGAVHRQPVRLGGRASAGGVFEPLEHGDEIAEPPGHRGSLVDDALGLLRLLRCFARLFGFQAGEGDVD